MMMVLNTDEARLALWKAIEAIRIGNATDDKLIVANLAKAGVYLAASTARPTERGAVPADQFQAFAAAMLAEVDAAGGDMLKALRIAARAGVDAALPATDQAAEVERLIEVAIKANPHREHRDYRTNPIYEEERDHFRPAVIAILAALATQPATGGTMGGEEVTLIEAAQDLLDARERLGPAAMERHDLWRCLADIVADARP